MNELQLGALIFVVTLLLLFTGIPVAFGLVIVAVGFLVAVEGWGSIATVGVNFYEQIASFALLTIPLFIFFGSAIGSSRAAADIYEVLNRWLIRVPGGLVIANIMACGSFSALCGSSPATAAAVGKVGVPEMRKRGIPAALATGAVAAGGTLGILIPPSITLIVYGIATEQSIGRLFLAGVGPGILIVLLFSLYVFVASWLNRQNADIPLPRYSLRERMEGVPRILPFLLIILFVLYALYGGLATPSEIAAVVAASSFLLVLFIYGRTSPRAWLGTLKETVRESTMILFIIAAAGLFSYMMSMLYVTQSVAEWIIATDMNRWVLFGFLNVLMLIAGCFLPPVAIILMVMPIIQPILMLNDFDMIWFGIVMTINLEIALITPPVGLNLYVLRGVSPDIPLKTILAGSVPFVLLMLLSIVILCFLPGIALWLPNALM